MSNGPVYWNGEVVPAGQAAVPVDDLGWLLGLGVFETLRAYQGRIFRLREHLSRLSATLEWLGIALPEGTAAVGRAAEMLVAQRGLQEARIRITVSAGAGIGGSPPNRLVTVRPADPPPGSAYEDGIRAMLRPLPHGLGPVAGHKVTSYAAYVLARRAAVAQGAGEALLVDPQGQVVEGAFSNLFLVRDGRLITPSLSQGPLPGVTRQVVLELLPTLGLSGGEGSVTPADLEAASEVFVTSSVAEILPVIRVGERPVADEQPGPVSRRLLEAYRAQVQRETSGSLDP